MGHDVCGNELRVRQQVVSMVLPATTIITNIMYLLVNI